MRCAEPLLRRGPSAITSYAICEASPIEASPCFRFNGAGGGKEGWRGVRGGGGGGGGGALAGAVRTCGGGCGVACEPPSASKAIGGGTGGGKGDNFGRTGGGEHGLSGKSCPLPLPEANCGGSCDDAAACPFATVVVITAFVNFFTADGIRFSVTFSGLSYSSRWSFHQAFVGCFKILWPRNQLSHRWQAIFSPSRSLSQHLRCSTSAVRGKPTFANCSSSAVSKKWKKSFSKQARAMGPMTAAGIPSA